MPDATLNTLEMLGALSARLAHALSNHLSVITGNLCVVAALRDDPEKTATALQAAMHGANQAGSLLGRFSDLRRAIKSDFNPTPIDAFVKSLEAWATRRNGWKSEISLDSSSNLEIAAPWPWLAFVLDSIANTCAASEAIVRLSRCSPPLRSRLPALTDDLAAGFVQVSLIWPAVTPIDWTEIRTNLTDLHLAAAYELLAHLGGSPESSPTETKIVLPILQTS